MPVAIGTTRLDLKILLK